MHVNVFIKEKFDDVLISFGVCLFVIIKLKIG